MAYTRISLPFRSWCILVFLILSFPLLSHGETIDRIVAIVNEDIVTLFDLNQILRPYENRIRSLGYPFEKEKEMLNKIRQDAVNQLVDQALADQEIKRLDISVSEKEIDQSIERVKEVNDYTEEDLEKTLKKEGITKEEFRKRIKDEILRTKLVNRQVKSKIVITKEDVESYYKAHPEIYGVKKSYRLRHILRRALRESDPESGKKVLKEMEDILTRLKQGDRFEDLAKKHSMMSAAEGGDLGVLDADDLSLQLQESLKGKKAGEFTEILDTDLGYQIVYIEEILQKPGKSMPEATEEIEEKLFREEVEKKYREWLKELRKKSHIKIIDS